MTSLSAPADPEILRQRAAKTEATLREIDQHLQRLQEAKAQRQAGLARIQAMLALCGPAAVNHHGHR